WQAHLIRRVIQGYDAFVIAGTGYGKSILFEAAAALARKPRRLVLVVAPLKALERDQAEQASAKGLKTVVLNEDTSKDWKEWDRARTQAQLAYLSPEMIQSDSFANRLWKDEGFRKRLAAVIVDEAHCIDEWGGDDFRPIYRDLHQLRVFTGSEVPVIACTATARTSTFSTIWKSLGFGQRPFWGIDVGIERPNLFFHVRALQHPRKPILEVLSFLPLVLNDRTTRSSIDKGIIYFDSEAKCRSMVNDIRKCLPPHLRDAVFAYSSNLSEKAKQRCWQRFLDGELRIICATDAAGMGCNVPNVQFIIIFLCPKSFAAVMQRWGRAGRDRVTAAYCLLIVENWAFRPRIPAVVARQVRGLPRPPKPESKTSAVKREKLDSALEQFINLEAPSE
ncbi:P-loop containing nucleoside triphosphate hydrolase protein, partial [Schizophyllum commune]